MRGAVQNNFAVHSRCTSTVWRINMLVFSRTSVTHHLDSSPYLLIYQQAKSNKEVIPIKYCFLCPCPTVVKGLERPSLIKWAHCTLTCHMWMAGTVTAEDSPVMGPSTGNQSTSRHMREQTEKTTGGPSWGTPKTAWCQSLKHFLTHCTPPTFTYQLTFTPQ